MRSQENWLARRRPRGDGQSGHWAWNRCSALGQPKRPEWARRARWKPTHLSHILLAWGNFALSRRVTAGL